MQIHISVRTFRPFLLFICFFKPPFVNEMSILKNAYQVMLLLTIVYISLSYIINRVKLTKLFIIVLILQVLLLLVTVLSKGSIEEARRNLQMTILAVAIIDLLSSEIMHLVKALLLHFEICLYMNIITIIIFPDGLYSRAISAYGRTKEWFLGADNGFVFWIIPALFIAWLYSEYSNHKRRSISIYIVSLLTVLMRGSSTGIISVVLLLALIFWTSLPKLLTPKRIIFLFLFLYLSIVVLKSSEYLQPLIVGVLGKDMTFTSRVFIWDNAFHEILLRPVLGHGVMYPSAVAKLLGTIPGQIIVWDGATHCHNQILQVLFQGGIVGLLLYLFIYTHVIYKLINNWSYRSSKICLYSIFVVFIIGITETTEFSLLYIIPFVSNKIDVFVGLSKQISLTKGINHL